MQHETSSGDGQRDLAPARQARFKSHAVPGSQRRAHRPALGDEFERACREGAAEKRDELRSGDLSRRAPRI